MLPQVPRLSESHLSISSQADSLSYQSAQQRTWCNLRESPGNSRQHKNRRVLRRALSCLALAPHTGFRQESHLQ